MMRSFLILLMLSTILLCCSESTSTTSTSISLVNSLLPVPDEVIEKSKLYFNNRKSLWTLNDSLYSGYAVTLYEHGALKEKFGILNGKKQNQSIQWYEDGHYKRIANYHRGKLYGDKKAWSYDSLHTLVSHLQYVSGKPHGEQKKWYETGEIFKILNLNMGKEEGIQQAYRKNGALYANYEAREGRIFGLKKTTLCFGLEDEVVQYEN